MRHFLPVIFVASIVKIKMTAAFLATVSHLDRCQLRPHSYNNHNNNKYNHHRLRKKNTASCSDASGSDEQLYDDANEAGGGFTALPPIGASSFWDRPILNGDDKAERIVANMEQSNNNIILSGDQTNLVSSKFQIQYTCKICSMRNYHSVSRLAYRKGVVIAMCKGCLCRHLLADNLGWSNYAGGFNFDEGETNIEIFMENKAREKNGERIMQGLGDDHETRDNDLVVRVNRDVFDLERTLYKGQGNTIHSKGAMKGVDQLGEDGNEMGWS